MYKWKVELCTSVHILKNWDCFLHNTKDLHLIQCGCIESFPFRQKLLFSSAKPRDLDGMLGTGLPVSMYTTKTPIDKCRFNVTQLKEFFFYIFCKRQISIKLFYLYQKLQCTDNYFFKIKFVLFLYLLLSAILATKAYRTMYDFLKRESS